MITEKMLMIKKIKEIYKLADEIQQKDSTKTIHIELFQYSPKKFKEFWHIGISIYSIIEEKVQNYFQALTMNENELEKIIQKIKEMKEEN